MECSPTAFFHLKVCKITLCYKHLIHHCRGPPSPTGEGYQKPTLDTVYHRIIFIQTKDKQLEVRLLYCLLQRVAKRRNGSEWR